MEDQKLNALLEKLHAEIHVTETVNPQDLALLAELEEDLRKLLAREGLLVEVDIHPSLRDLLQRAVAQFEAAHPALTRALDNVLSTLSSSGI